MTSTSEAIQKLNSYWYHHPIEAEIESELIQEQYDKFELDFVEQFEESMYE